MHLQNLKSFNYAVFSKCTDFDEVRLAVPSSFETVRNCTAHRGRCRVCDRILTTDKVLATDILCFQAIDFI